MKKLIIVISAIMLINFSCTNKVNDKGEYVITSPDIIRYNGCQYIRFGTSSVSWGSHSGTCNNPIHQKQ